jgi:hypothetical protein
METLKKLTPEDLTKLQDFNTKINQNTFELGQLEIDLYNLSTQLEMAKSQKDQVLDFLKTMTNAQSDFLKSLESKYGGGNIDLNTGEIS